MDRNKKPRFFIYLLWGKSKNLIFPPPFLLLSSFFLSFYGKKKVGRGGGFAHTISPKNIKKKKWF